MARMKALMVRQPYASWIVKGEKTIEWRSWRTDYRGPLAVCTPRKPSQELTQYLSGAAREDGLTEADFPLGVALGIIDLVDCVPFNWDHLGNAKMKNIPDPAGWAWIVKSFGRFKELLPVTGELLIFEIDLPDPEKPEGEEAAEGKEDAKRESVEDMEEAEALAEPELLELKLGLAQQKKLPSE